MMLPVWDRRPMLIPSSLSVNYTLRNRRKKNFRPSAKRLKMRFTVSGELVVIEGRCFF
jgi:hypothetical protein